MDSSHRTIITIGPLDSLFQTIARRGEDISQLATYEYRPLETPRTIRLLELVAGGEYEPLICELRHADLDDTLVYNALSYAWGDPQKPHNIRIGNRRLPITSSLNSALRDLRACNIKRDRNPIFWVDALSIDQKNVAERSQQVSIMGDIYRKASAVSTYIGPEGDNSQAGLRLAKLLVEYSEKQGGGSWLDVRNITEENFTRLGFPPANDPSWDALRRLLSRPWSSRVWMVQEALLNKTLIMICGRTFFYWGLLGTIAHLSVNSRIPRLATTHEVGRGMDLLIAQNSLHDYAKEECHQYDTFYHLLRMCHPFLSTDPRDKVFALLGVAHDREKLGIVPDYHQSTAHVYTNVAVRLLQTYPTLDLFSSVYRDKSVHLPTWIPDWTTLPEKAYEPFANHPILPRYGLNRAGADSRSEVEFNGDLTQLHVKGAFIDRISHVDDKRAAYEAGSKGGFACFAFLTQELDRLETLPMYAHYGSIGFDKWRTMLKAFVPNHQGPQSQASAFSVLEACLRLDAALSERSEISMTVNAETLKMIQELMAAFHATATNRAFFTTEKGYIGLGPPDTKAGDLACILLGGRFPYVLRESGDNFELVGESYVHRMMKGEAFGLEAFEIRSFTLV